MKVPGHLSKIAAKASRERAFSLIEVVVALGVASFTLISMMGLLTVGLQTFHAAKTATTETEIAQQLANQLQLANYSTLVSSSASTNYYFSMEGVSVNSSSGAVFAATISAPQKLALPGASTSPSASTNTSTFILNIWCVTSPQTTNAIPIQIANNGS